MNILKIIHEFSSFHTGFILWYIIKMITAHALLCVNHFSILGKAIENMF